MQNIPNHIVLFPDGNRRWSKGKGLISLEGHKKGYENLLDFSEWCKNRGVKTLTAFGFSTENWNRSKEEVDYLMKLLENCLTDNLNRYDRDGVRVRVIGQRDRLPKSLQVAIKKSEEKIRGMTIVQAIGDLALLYLDRFGVTVTSGTGEGFYAGPENMFGATESQAIGNFIVIHGETHGITLRRVSTVKSWPTAEMTR